LIVPLADLRAQYNSLKEEIDAATVAVIESSCFIDGHNVDSLETQIAAACGATYGIAVASGTDALVLSLVACGIGRGDEVITTPFTFGATTEAIALVGATPVYVDIDGCTFNLNTEQIESKITDKTRALLPVDLFGQMTDRAVLSDIAARHNLKLINDSAQAIGSLQNKEPIAHTGDTTTLSFYPTKNLGAYGDGGMVLTNNQSIANMLTTLRGHGQTAYGFHEYIGYCSRLDSLQAAILKVKLPHLSAWNEKRRRNADVYNALLADTAANTELLLPKAEPGNYHVYHQYTIRHPRRNQLQAFLKNSGIDTKIFYPLPMHLQNAYKYLGYAAGDFPAAEQVASEVLSLPIHPELTDDQIQYVAARVQEFCTL
jgi:dTDP-4-amino-4,6-dideoxygalactose transaminase